jgi:hypothetical protein
MNSARRDVLWCEAVDDLNSINSGSYEATVEETNLKSIRIIFQPKGTLGFPPDATFSIFKRKFNKHQQIETPEEFMQIVDTAPKNPGLWSRTPLVFTDIIDWNHRIEKTCNLKGRKDSNGEKFRISKTAVWEFRRSDPRILFFKYSLFDDEPFKTVNYSKSLKTKRHTKIKASNIRQKYRERRPLKLKKFLSLRKLSTYLRKNSSKEFYQRLPVDHVVSDSRSDTNSDSDSDAKNDEKTDSDSDDDLEPFWASFDQFLPKEEFDKFVVAHSYQDKRKIFKASRRRLLMVRRVGCGKCF